MLCGSVEEKVAKFMPSYSFGQYLKIPYILGLSDVQIINAKQYPYFHYENPVLKKYRVPNNDTAIE